ncbi:MAG: amidohydrolase [Promethearchaeota archaeon]|jgi:aminobenzoyl-glutamate utilization protein B
MEISDKIWGFAELGFREHKSAKELIKILKENDFTVDENIAEIPTAFVASYGDGSPTIAVLGEYDALPGLSQSTDFIRKPLKEGTPGHGCGHNLLGVAGVGAVLSVKKALDNENLKGTIKYYGCPAEEMFNTKGYMINPGQAFENIDISITWHPGSINAIAVQSNTAMNDVFFKFHGRTAHAAADPYSGRSALDAVELMNIGANYMREHMIRDARIHYVITNGGLAPNVVPAEAEVHYFVRAPERHQVDELYNRLIKIAEGAVLMTETRLEINFMSGTYNPLRNDIVNNVIYEKMKDLGPPVFNEDEIRFAIELKKTFPPPDFTGMKKIIPPQHWERAMKNLQEPFFPTVAPPLGKGTVAMGSTDVGDVSWYTPLGEFATVCQVNGSPGHSWQNVATSGMSIGHKGMIKAAQIICLTALEFLNNIELVEKARKEFDNTFKEKHYESPFPDGYKLTFNRLIKT